MPPSHALSPASFPRQSTAALSWWLYQEEGELGGGLHSRPRATDGPILEAVASSRRALRRQRAAPPDIAAAHRREPATRVALLLSLPRICANGPSRPLHLSAPRWPAAQLP